MRNAKNIVIGLLLLTACHSYALGQSHIDSLRQIVDKNKVPDSTYIKDCVELCKSLVNTDEAYLLPQYAIKGLMADTLNRDIQSKFALYGFLGNYYWQIGKVSEAAEQFNQMRLIGETTSNPIIAANSFIGLGTVYYIMNDINRAREYYRKALTLSGGDSLLQAKCYGNIANTYLVQDMIDSALLYYKISINYFNSFNYIRQKSIIYGNMALAYKKLNDGHGVKENINRSLDAAIKTDDPYQIASVYQNMGQLSLEKHPDLSAKSYSRALELARKSKSYDQIKISLENLARLSENAGRYKEAFTHLNELKNMGDSLDLIQKKSRIRQMEFEHLASLRNAEENEKAYLENLKSVKDQNRQKNLLALLIIAFAVVLILFLTGIRNYRMKMKIARTKESFFSMIAHDIRNPFSGILGLSGILNEKAENSEDLVHRKQVQSLHKSLNQVYELLENLLQWSQAETGKIAFNPQVQLLSPFVHEVICLHNASGKQKGITIENQVQSDLTARFDSNMLQTVIRNLLSNAIKFTRENSSIFLSAEIRGSEVVVKVRDEGIGMNEEQIERVFKAESGASTPGTRNETGTGLGLILCKTFINRHGGKIWVESKPGIGTTVFFTLPDRA